jgi:hypothetical protein
VIQLGEMQNAIVHAATWCCNRRCALDLLELIDAGKIKEMNLIVGLYLKKREQSVFATLANGLIDRGQRLLANECHAKIFSIQHGEKYYTIEGSANWTSNPRIEQFTIIRDKGLHDFHADWIRNAFIVANKQ